MTPCLPEPDWAPFAAGIRQRLTRTLDAKSSRYGYESVLIAPEDSTGAAAPDGDLLPCEAESDAALGETAPEAEPPAHVLSVRQLQLTLQAPPPDNRSSMLMFRRRNGQAASANACHNCPFGTKTSMSTGFPVGRVTGKKPDIIHLWMPLATGEPSNRRLGGHQEGKPAETHWQKVWSAPCTCCMPPPEIWRAGSRT